MKLVIQKVSHASVETEGASIAEIQKGFLVLVGIGKNDTKETIDQYVKKMVNLRIFTDENGKTNLSLKDVNGEILLVSQFTLYANCKKGNRPSFFDAGEPEKAQQLYEYMVEKVKEFVPVVQTGKFGALMKVSLINEGPFTILLDENTFAALTTLAAASLLVFCLLYTPCVAAIAAVKRELGGKWAVLVVLWQCGIAWIAAMIVKIIGNLMGVM